MTIKVMLTILGLFIGSPSYADELKFAEGFEYGGSKLVLNGVGIREATIFKVDVYQAGLYLSKKSKDAEAIVVSPTPKYLLLKFVRNVGASDMKDAFEEGFKKNCKKNCEALKSSLGKLVSTIPDLKEGHRLAFGFVPNKIELFVNGQTKGSFDGVAFDQAMLRLWLGEPPNSGLKTGMLGQKD